MENLYRSWTEFNKIQNHVFKGERAGPILKLSEDSVTQWNGTGYPQGEFWKYLSFKELPQTHFHFPSQDRRSEQVADGEFVSLEIKNFKTPQSIKLGALPEGMTIVSELETLADNSIENDVDNPFSKFSHSFYGLGLKVQFDKDFKNEKPLKLIFNFDSFSEKDLFLQQNISIEVAEGVAAQVFVEVLGEKWSGFSNLCFRSLVKTQGNLQIYFKELGGPQSHYMVNSFTDVHKEARLKCLDVTMSSRWSRHNLRVSLKEKGAVGDISGAYLNHSDNFVDHHTSLRHEVGSTDSKEDYRGILAEKAQAVFNGNVYIAPGASKSNSEQINKNLMLSKTAEIDTKPELQIYNDDVKAAHGATVGQLDEEQRFYLQSRGYSSEQAGKVLAKAFVYDLLDEGDKRVLAFFEKDLEKTLHRLEGAQ